MNRKEAVRYLDEHGIERGFQHHGSRVDDFLSVFFEPEQLAPENDRWKFRGLHHEASREANLPKMMATGSWVPVGSALVLKDPFEMRLRIDSAYSGQTRIEALFFMAVGKLLWPNVDLRGHDDYWRWG
jgi:hypothetical protein